MVEEYIQLLRPEVEKIFGNDSTGHDVSHLDRTMNTALGLQKIEGGDEVVIGVSAFLHDIHRIMQNEKGAYCEPKDSLPKIREILEKINFPEDKIEKVLHCVEFHEVYNWNEISSQVRDIETLILQDADNLDAIGAIGIARTFAYGGANNISMYDPSIPMEFKDVYIENGGNSETTIHHFYHKLFKLGDNMNTNTAKELATSRIEYMKDFVEHFLNEWNGNI